MKHRNKYLDLKQSIFIFENQENRYIFVPNISIRKSVILSISKKGRKKSIDPNRELMIKFKYDQATIEEQNLLHENIKNLIYKVMHKNYVQMEFEDVYHEIWKKIIKSKHTWDENNGTRVSTWIVVVANSVINTLRMNITKYHSRYCLYGDLNANNEDESANDMADVISLNNDEDNSFTNNVAFNDDYKIFCNSLKDNEKELLDNIIELASQRNDGKISLRKIGKQIGVDSNNLTEMLNQIKSKFYQVFDNYSSKEDFYHASKKD